MLGESKVSLQRKLEFWFPFFCTPYPSSPLCRASENILAGKVFLLDPLQIKRRSRKAFPRNMCLKWGEDAVRSNATDYRSFFPTKNWSKSCNNNIAWKPCTCFLAVLINFVSRNAIDGRIAGLYFFHRIFPRHRGTCHKRKLSWILKSWRDVSHSLHSTFAFHAKRPAHSHRKLLVIQLKNRNNWDGRVCFRSPWPKKRRRFLKMESYFRERKIEIRKRRKGERRKITRLLSSELRENMFLSILGGKVSSCLIYPLRSNNPGVLNASSVVPYPETPSKILNCN